LIESENGSLECFVTQKSGFLEYGNGINIFTPDEVKRAFSSSNLKLSTYPRNLKIHHLHSISGLTTWDVNHQ